MQYEKLGIHQLNERFEENEGIGIQKTPKNELKITIGKNELKLNFYYSDEL